MCFEEQRGVHMWNLQQCLYFVFPLLREICFQEKCELVKIILGKPENSINHLIAFKNKAMLLCNKCYHVKAGSEVIYGNLLEIFTRRFPTVDSKVMHQRIFISFVNFLKVLFLLS